MVAPSATQRLPVVVAPGSRPSLAVGRTSHVFDVVSHETGGQVALMEATIQPHTLVIPHQHTHEDELAFVLEGEAGIRVGGQDYVVSPGFVIFIPRGTVHAIWNPTDTPGKAISIFIPGGLESFFTEMAAVFQEQTPPDRAKLGAISQKYGIVTHMEWVPELSAKYGVKLG
jgi:quercetin dioxygenase-like cupin family protein